MTQSAKNTTQFQPGDVVGAFSGFLRRPKSTAAGLIAQIFGENGEDADVITALHLSNYQEMNVKVSIWLIKDQHGVIRKEKGQYPLITHFIAKNRRPSPSTSGQTAQFFGENGINSDAINELNKTEFLDSLVFVEIQYAGELTTVQSIKTETPTQELEKDSQKLTGNEVRQLKKQQKYAEEANRLLVLHGFYRNETIWNVVGNSLTFENWMKSQPCCHPGDSPCTHTDIHLFYLPNKQHSPYRALPLCTEHKHYWEQGDIQGVVNPTQYLQTRHIHLMQQFIEMQLKTALKVPETYEIPPRALYQWALQNRVQQYLPTAYLNFI